MLELGLRIATTRQQLGISQKELAEKSHVTQQ
ncbi:MAG: helix-turn-helix domain-containing protein [Treponema sp.]|nr:helix-turn-helix domain-containing protein [Treponema sp.]